jgi:hypothetical protein
LRGISGFMKYWKKLSNEDSTGEYRRRYEHLWYYWRAVKDALDLPIQPLPFLRDGFWPLSRIALACSLKSILFKNNLGNTIVERFFWGRLD